MAASATTLNLPPLPPPPSPSLPPPRPPRNYSWVKPVVLYGGLAGGVVLVGYGIYSFLSNVSGGQSSQTLNNCEGNWQSAFAAYSAQYQAYVKANGGAALSSTQEASLQQYVALMNSAEQCMLSASNASSQTFASALTSIAIAVAATLGTLGAFRAYLNYRGGQLKSGAEARGAMRNSVVQTDVDAQTLDTADASALESQTNATTQSEAEEESAALGSTANADLAAAEAAGDSSLAASIEGFTSTVIDTITDAAYAVFDYFSALL
jgi:hypothetical protein